MRTKVLLSLFVLFALLASCNMPAGQTPVNQPPENKPVSLDAEAIGTAVELTAAAKFTEMAGSVTATVATGPTFTATPTATLTSTSPAPAQCNPSVTATVNANVRSGPSTDYDVVGALNPGQTATVIGRNDAYTWWYIDFPAAAGGHAWVAGSVVTSACVPSVVQVVAAPPLPTATATEVANNLLPLLPLKPLPFNALGPDLTVANMDVQPSVLVGVAIEVKVKVKNKGSGDASSFTVQWWAGSEVGCSWSVNSLAAGASKNLSTCSYAFPSAGDYTVKTVVDAGATVAESNENNNTSQETVQASKLIPLKPKLPPIIIQP